MKSKISNLKVSREVRGVFLPLISSFVLFLLFRFIANYYLETQLPKETLAYSLLFSPWIQYGVSLGVTLLAFMLVRLPIDKKGLLAFWWPLLSVSLAGTLIGMTFILLSDTIPAVQQSLQERSPVILLTLNALVYVVALAFFSLPAYRYFFGRSHSKKHIFGLQRGPEARDFILVFLAFGAYFLTSAVVIAIVGNLFTFIDLQQPQELGLNNPETVAQYVLIFLMLVVVAPVAEELLFRGFMFKALRERLSFWPTAILVSVLFGIAHGQWNVGVDTFVLSIFLCGLREYTGALWACILLHAVKNLLAFSLLFLFPDIIPALQ